MNVDPTIRNNTPLIFEREDNNLKKEPSQLSLAIVDDSRLPQRCKQIKLLCHHEAYTQYFTFWRTFEMPFWQDSADSFPGYPGDSKRASMDNHTNQIECYE